MKQRSTWHLKKINCFVRIESEWESSPDLIARLKSVRFEVRAWDDPLWVFVLDQLPEDGGPEETLKSSIEDEDRAAARELYLRLKFNRGQFFLEILEYKSGDNVLASIKGELVREPAADALFSQAQISVQGEWWSYSYPPVLAQSDSPV